MSKVKRLSVFLGVIVTGFALSPSLFIKIIWYITAIFILLEGGFLILYSFISLLRGKKKKASVTSSFHPQITIVIPVHNEEKVIGATIKSVWRTNYPKERFQIVVVNDASTDKTREVCEAYQKKGMIKLINRSSFAEKGKAISINETLSNIEDEFICIIDADHETSPDFFSKLVPHLEDPTVAVVQGRLKPKNFHANLLTRLIDVDYTNFYTNLLFAQKYGGLTKYMGTAAIFRTAVLKELKGFNNALATEDWEISFRMYEHGYKIVYEPSGESYEEVVTTIRDYWRQRYRWMLGTIQSFILHFPQFYLNKKIGFRQKMDFTNVFLITASLVSTPIMIFVSIIKNEIGINLPLSHLTPIIYTGIGILPPVAGLFLDNQFQKKWRFVLLMPLYYMFLSLPTIKGVVDEYILCKKYIREKTVHWGR